MRCLLLGCVVVCCAEAPGEESEAMKRRNCRHHCRSRVYRRLLPMKLRSLGSLSRGAPEAEKSTPEHHCALDESAVR